MDNDTSGRPPDLNNNGVQVTTDEFLGFIFDECQGVVVTANAEHNFQSHRWTPGTALSGCVYFCISTVRETDPRATVMQRRTQDLVLTYVVVLDDVGTKVDASLIKAEPSYVIETSPGNFQYGFIFEDGVDPQRAAALVEACAQAGLTDKGAKRADRIMRVPGSLNLKYDPPFAARITKWTGRTYTFSELCAKLDVVPTDTPALSTGPTPMPNSMTDPLETAIYRLGWALGEKNPRGWIPMRCPDEHLHSGEVDHGTDYLPGMPGVFKCQHAHCQGKTVVWLRDRVREALPGVDLDLIPRDVMQSIAAKARKLFKLDPPESQDPGASPGLFAALLEQAQRGTIFDGAPVRAGEKLELDADAVKAQILSDVVHVAAEDTYYSISGRHFMKHRAIDDAFYLQLRHAGLLDSVTPSGNPTVIAPHIWIRRQSETQRASRVTHRLGEPVLVNGELNIAPPIPEPLWSPGGDPPVPAEPAPWLELVDYICGGNGTIADAVLDWMAMTVSSWQEKPGHHILIRGPQGTGKNLVVRPLEQHCKPDHWSMVTHNALEGQFNSYVTKRLLTVDELKMTTKGAATAHDIYNTIKAYTTRTADRITVMEKYRLPYECNNLSCWWLTSNEVVPLGLDEDDRRFLVIETPRDKWPLQRYLDLVAWLDQGGDQAVVAWLQERWHSMTGQQRDAVRSEPMMTRAKRDLIEASDALHMVLLGAIGGRHDDAWPDLMHLDDIRQRLTNPMVWMLTESQRKALTRQRLAVALRQIGAVALRDGERIKIYDESRPDGTRGVRLWCMRKDKAAAYEAMSNREILQQYDRQKQAVGVGGGMHAMLKPVED
jgi:uncharacterized protein DUF5906